MPGVCANRVQMLGPAPSAIGDPSIWCSAVAAPQRKPSVKRRAFGLAAMVCSCKRLHGRIPPHSAHCTVPSAESEPMAQVSLEQVRKVYPNGFVGVAGATFDVADGELLVLVGPSG